MFSQSIRPSSRAQLSFDATSDYLWRHSSIWAEKRGYNAITFLCLTHAGNDPNSKHPQLIFARHVQAWRRVKVWVLRYVPVQDGVEKEFEHRRDCRASCCGLSSLLQRCGGYHQCCFHGNCHELEQCQFEEQFG